jgi:lambda repressor-like predicted transcriptional regulator
VNTETGQWDGSQNLETNRGKISNSHQLPIPLAEKIVLHCSVDPYLDLTALSQYSGISKRKLSDFLKHPIHPLPCYRIIKKNLVRRSEYDIWARRFRQVGHSDVDKIVADILSDI